MRARRAASNVLASTITAAMLLAVIVAFASSVHAAPSPTGGAAGLCPPGAKPADCAIGGLTSTAETAGLKTPRTLPQIIGTLAYAALSLTGVIFIILMIYAGILWMQARGNEEDAQKAKKIIENAIIGIIITALAFAITNFILARVIEAQTGEEAPLQRGSQ